MGSLVLQLEDLQKKPALLTFSYGRSSKIGGRRSWQDLMELSTVNLWLILAANLLFTAFLTLIVVLYVWASLLNGNTFGERLKLATAAVLYISQSWYLVPNELRLFNSLRGKGYTPQTERATLQKMVADYHQKKGHSNA